MKKEKEKDQRAINEKKKKKRRRGSDTDFVRTRSTHKWHRFCGMKRRHDGWLLQWWSSSSLERRTQIRRSIAATTSFHTFVRKLGLLSPQTISIVNLQSERVPINGGGYHGDQIFKCIYKDIIVESCYTRILLVRRTL